MTVFPKKEQIMKQGKRIREKNSINNETLNNTFNNMSNNKAILPLLTLTFNKQNEASCKLQNASFIALRLVFTKSVTSFPHQLRTALSGSLFPIMLRFARILGQLSHGRFYSLFSHSVPSSTKNRSKCFVNILYDIINILNTD